MPGFAPKLRVLTSNETPTTFNAWKETLQFHLTLDGTFEEFLDDDSTWGSVKLPNRGLRADGEEVKLENRKTAKQKAMILKTMLGTIASYAPIISREFVVSEALSLNDIWNRLRIHFGFRKSGSLILDLMSITREEGESYESLWERYHAFITDNLLQPGDKIFHQGVLIATKEEISPTLHNIMVTLWLNAINVALPGLVKQKYTTELRNTTLSSLREDISESIDSLLSQIDQEGACIARAFYGKGQSKRQYRNPGKPSFIKNRPARSCALCETAGRPMDHFLSECKYLPEADRKFMSSKAKFRAVDTLEDSDEDEDLDCCGSSIKQINISDEECTCKCKPQNDTQTTIPTKALKPNINRVDVVSSPCLWVKYGKHRVNLTLDTAAEADVMRLSFAKKIGAPISSTSISAVNADGKTDLKTVGEVHLFFTWEHLRLRFDGLVVEDLSDDVLAGAPFMTVNDVYARPAHKKVFIGDIQVPYEVRVRAKKAQIMRVPRQKVIMPGETIRLQVPDSLSTENELAIEPRIDAKSMHEIPYKSQWLRPAITSQNDGFIDLQNSSTEPVIINRHEQIAMVRPVSTTENENTENMLPSRPTLPPLNSKNDPEDYTTNSKTSMQNLRKP